MNEFRPGNCDGGATRAVVQEGGRKARPYGIACLLLALVLLAALLLAGCAGGKRELDPNYVQYLTALDTHARNSAAQDRSLVDMGTHDGRPIKIDADYFRVNAPPAPLPTPEQFRDFTAEMTVQAWRDGLLYLGGPLAQGLFGYLDKREDRKIYSNLVRYGGSPTWTNAEGGTQVFTGGWGDRENMGTGSFSEGMTLQPFEVRPEVVRPEVVRPGGE